MELFAIRVMHIKHTYLKILAHFRSPVIFISGYVLDSDACKQTTFNGVLMKVQSGRWWVGNMKSKLGIVSTCKRDFT